MGKFLRRSTAVAGLIVVFLVAFGREKAAPTGKWLVRANLQAHTLHVGRFDIRYVRKGAGPTVILIHGLASSIYTWSDVINLLAEKFDVVAFDLPGFGESTQPADLAFADYIPAVLGVMKALDIQKAHFVGNSMGGAISLLMAAREADHVDRVAVLDSAGFNLGQGDRPFAVKLLGSRAAGLAAENLPVRRMLTNATLRHLIHDDTRVTDERINEYLAPILRPGALDSARSLLASRLDENFTSDMPKIQARTLIIWGRFDPWLPEAHADRFVASIKGARKVMLETGHMPQEELPADVARIIGEFLLS
ncbi:MAG: alpha/beta fold hydrolase [Vicinamibacteria bacterium]